MKVKILGSGHAYETPNQDCDCKTCYSQQESGDIRDYRMNTSLAIKSGNNSNFLLIDCGPDFKGAQKKMLRDFAGIPNGYSVANGMNILQTHSHPDHSLGLPHLESAVRNGSPIPTYAHKECFGRLDKMGFEYLFEFGTLEKNIATPGERFSVGDMDITPFKVEHNKFIAPGAMGYIIDSEDARIVYTGDFGSMKNPETIIKDGRPIDHLISECNWFNSLKDRNDHMSLQGLIPYLEIWNPKNLSLVHLGSDDELIDGESLEKYSFKKEPVDPMPFNVPKTHVEWENTVKEILSSNHHGLRCSSQEVPFISHDGLGFKIGN